MSRIKKAYYYLACIIFIVIWNINSYAAPSKLIFIEADQREPNQLEFLEANGFDVSIMEPFRISIVGQTTINLLNNADLVMVICSSAVILLALITSRNNSILRSHGAVFIALYAGYLFYVTTR